VTLALIFVYIPLRFPTGRLLSARCRIVAWLGAVGVGGISALGAVAEHIGLQVSQAGEGPGTTIPNPLGVEGLAHVEQLPIMGVFGGLFVAALLGAFASLVVRFRRSRGVERQQMKWLVLAAALFPPTIGLAILRYRLYDIDRLISRAVSYILLTALLVGVYVGGVVSLGWLIRAVTGATGGDLVVAASTLAVVTAFQPLRRHVQPAPRRRGAAPGASGPVGRLLAVAGEPARTPTPRDGALQQALSPSDPRLDS
jgi:hypothetical protein